MLYRKHVNETAQPLTGRRHRNEQIERVMKYETEVSPFDARATAITAGIALCPWRCERTTAARRDARRRQGSGRGSDWSR